MSRRPTFCGSSVISLRLSKPAQKSEWVESRSTNDHATLTRREMREVLEKEMRRCHSSAAYSNPTVQGPAQMRLIQSEFGSEWIRMSDAEDCLEPLLESARMRGNVTGRIGFAQRCRGPRENPLLSKLSGTPETPPLPCRSGRIDRGQLLFKPSGCRLRDNGGAGPSATSR